MNFLRSVLLAAAGDTSVPAAPPAISIPKISELAKEPGGTGKPPAVQQPPTPPAEPKPPGAPPALPIATDPEIDTQIVKPRGDQTHVPTPAGGKTPADYARERAVAKQREQSQTIEEANRRADEALMQYQQRQTEFEELQRKHAELENKYKEVETAANTRKTEVEQLQVQYYDNNRVTLDLNSDQDLQQHSALMLQELRGNLPSRVRTPAGTDARVFFDAILQQTGASQGLNEILGAYSRAKQLGNEASCDLAVNALAKMLGADVDMTGRDENAWRLLKPDDPTFRAIETAMDRALPHFANRNQRITSFQQNAPQLARQQFDQRVIGIRQNLANQIFLAPEVAAGRLRANQQDSEALFSQIVTQVPAMKQMVEQIIQDVSPTFAALSGKLNLPTLVENTPAAISAHQQEVQRHQTKLNELMRASIIGRAAPTVIAVLAAERDAAEARADAAAQNTNPGGGRRGGEGGAPEPEIDTQIVKPRM